MVSMHQEVVKIAGITVGVTTAGILSGLNFGAAIFGIPSLLTAKMPAHYMALAWRYHFEEGVRRATPLILLTAGSFFGSAYAITRAPQYLTIFGITQAQQMVLAGITVLGSLPFTGLVMMPNVRRVKSFAKKAEQAEKRGEVADLDPAPVVEGLEIWRMHATVRGWIMAAAGIVALTGIRQAI